MDRTNRSAFQINRDDQAGTAVKRLLNMQFLLRLMIVIALVACGDTLVHAQDAAPPAPAGETNFLIWIIKVSGAIGVFIFGLSVYFCAVTIKQVLELKQQVAAPPEILAAVDGLIEERRHKELVQLLQEDDSYFSQALVAGIGELKFGLEEAREKLDRKADSLTVQMERSISILAVIGTLGPMIGLLGTLKGMIASFGVIAMSGVALEAAKVAEGISEALVLTFEGVLLSVPAIFFYSVFKNRISQISVETTMLADDRLRACFRSLKTKSEVAFK